MTLEEAVAWKHKSRHEKRCEAEMYYGPREQDFGDYLGDRNSAADAALLEHAQRSLAAIAAELDQVRALPEVAGYCTSADGRWVRCWWFPEDERGLASSLDRAKTSASGRPSSYPLTVHPLYIGPAVP